MWINVQKVKEICGYRVVENHEDYCLVEMYGRQVRVDGQGCATEQELCFIDDNGVPHSTGYLNLYDKCELDKLDNALMVDLSADKCRRVQEWIENSFVPIKSYNRNHSTYSLKRIVEEKTGIYLTNNQMKDALLKMGYTCQNEHKMNWFVNVSERAIRYIK